MNTNINFLTIRSKLGLNQTEYAKKLDSSQNLISKYEKGQVELPYKIINNLNKVFNIDINWLLTGNGDMLIANHILPVGTDISANNLLVLTPDEHENLASDEHASLIADNQKKYGASKVDILINDIKQLSTKRQEYYYHRVKADLLDDEL